MFFNEIKNCYSVLLFQPKFIKLFRFKLDFLVNGWNVVNVIQNFFIVFYESGPNL